MKYVLVVACGVFVQLAAEGHTWAIGGAVAAAFGAFDLILRDR